jgi:hypothetical protein
MSVQKIPRAIGISLGSLASPVEDNLDLSQICYNSTVWAADFETPAGSTSFFSFFLAFGSIGRNKQEIKFAHWCFKVCHPYSTKHMFNSKKTKPPWGSP